MNDELPRTGRQQIPRRPLAGDPPEVLRLHQSDDLVEAIPYLIGFRPRDSVVLVGIEGGPGGPPGSGGRVRITVRMDIADLSDPAPDPGTSVAGGPTHDRPTGYSPTGHSPTGHSPTGHSPTGEHRAALEDGALRAATAIRRSGATAVVGVVFVDSPGAGAQADEASARAVQACVRAGLELGDLVMVAASEAGGGGGGSADGGPRVTSRVAAEATYAGLVALDDRQDLVELLAPEPATQRARLRAALDAEERLVSGVDIDGHRRRRRAVRALFAATRTLAVVQDADVVRFGAALSTIEVRDACWLAVEAGRLDGEALWRELARRLPAPYDAAPLFLFGWQRWRNGDGVLAAIAARSALDSDAAYTAAELLQLAVTDGLDPFRTPRLRKGA